ncbi:MAG: signal peptidase I [Acidobacteria bacterium]|nr:signal peptidase I [Acidobacteriota bacterium]
MSESAVPQMAGPAPEPQAPIGEPPPRRRWFHDRGRRRLHLTSSLQSLLVTLICAVFIVTFLEQPFQIPTSSMENTLLVGDYLLVDKVHFAGGGIWGRLLPYEPIRRGDIVVFHYPIHPEQHFVKRVIGMPGDRVKLLHKQVFVNGHPLAEPYAVHITGDIQRYRDDFPQPFPVPDQNPRWWVDMRKYVRDGELTVPPDQYFVLGDNRDNSEDSRYWGFVPRENVEGTPLLIYWSMDPDRPMASTLANDKLSELADIFYYVLQIPRWHRALHVVR